MNRFLTTALLIISFFSQNIQKESYLHSLSKEANHLLNQNWILEDVIIDPQNANSQSLLLFSHPTTSEKIFLCEENIVARGIFDSWEIHYIQSPTDFLLCIKSPQGEQLISRKKVWGFGEKIIVEKRDPQEFPSFLIQSNGIFSLYVHKEFQTTVPAQKALFLPPTNKNPNILFQLASGQYQLYHNQELSKPFKAPILWNRVQNEEGKGFLSVLIERKTGKYQILEGGKSSPLYESSIQSLRRLSDEELFQDHPDEEKIFANNAQVVTLLDPKTKEWFFSFEGKLYGPWEEEPLAFTRLPSSSGKLAWAGKQEGKWFWIKDNITIAETEPFSFQSGDIQFCLDSFALIRKKETRYEIYANFESRGIFYIKPSFHFINENLLQATDNETHFVLYQLAYNQFLKQERPFQITIFQEDFFDFWLEEGGVWKAYKEGEMRGEIRTSKKSDLMVFLINHSLFFPKKILNSEGEEEIYLVGEKGSVGPFQSLIPLEHPNQRHSGSTLFSSLIANTPEGVISLYTDAIIGPADSIVPHFDPHQPGKVLGLQVDFANIPHYYQKGKGLIPLQNLPNIKKALPNIKGQSLPPYEGPKPIAETTSSLAKVSPSLASWSNGMLTVEILPKALRIVPHTK